MLIRENGRSHSLVVITIYWVKGIRYHFVIPEEDYGGLIVIPEKKCVVTDPSIDGFFLRRSESCGDMLVHWAADRDDLLVKLVDHDASALIELKRRLREEAPPTSVPKELPPPL